MKTRYSIRAFCFDKRGRLLSVGKNSYTKTHPIQKYFAQKVGKPECEFLHAEIDAILKAKGKQIHKLVIERFSRKGERLNASPCPICEEAIRAYGIINVEHS